MTRSATWCAGPLVLFATFVMSGCGSSRQLQSVTLAPASADAQSFRGGQVQFAASGTFSEPPSPVQLTSKDVQWCVGTSTGACVGNINPGASVDQNGLAQCNTGFVGTVNILAGNVATMPMNPDTGARLKTFGAAKLTCP
jgi:hypothetical protein